MANLDIPRLLELAYDGDSYAARNLDQLKTNCSRAPKSQAELETEITNFQQSLNVGYSQTEGIQLVDPDDVPLLIEQMRRDFERCQLARERLKDVDTDFLKLAADSGSSVAMIDYGNKLPPDRGEEARSYFTQAWLAGDPEGLKPLSKLALEEYEDYSNPNGLIDSIAYFIAYATLTDERLRATNGHIHIVEANEINEMATEKLSTLTPGQRKIAVEQAIELARQNANCCLKMGF